MARGNWIIKHGGNRRGKRTPEYSVWAGMRRRCGDVNDNDYGGRGITVCDRWLDFSTFLLDMGPRPMAHSIERINNDGNYEPSNCVWATRKVQAHNRRPRKLRTHCAKGHPLTESNTYIRANGKRCCRACRKAAMRAFYERQKRAER